MAGWACWAGGHLPVAAVGGRSCHRGGVSAQQAPPRPQQRSGAPPGESQSDGRPVESNQETDQNTVSRTQGRWGIARTYSYLEEFIMRNQLDWLTCLLTYCALNLYFTFNECLLMLNVLVVFSCFTPDGQIWRLWAQFCSSTETVILLWSGGLKRRQRDKKMHNLDRQTAKRCLNNWPSRQLVTLISLT